MDSACSQVTDWDAFKRDMDRMEKEMDGDMMDMFMDGDMMDMFMDSDSDDK